MKILYIEKAVTATAVEIAAIEIRPELEPAQVHPPQASWRVSFL
jgi:hypothetical protein